MSQSPQPTADEAYQLPPVEALLAGAMALMTGYAQASADCPHRPLMARKLVSNLLLLSDHPQLSPPMQLMVGNLRTRWQLEIEKQAGDTAHAPPPEVLWHTAPGRMQ